MGGTEANFRQTSSGGIIRTVNAGTADTEKTSAKSAITATTDKTTRRRAGSKKVSQKAGKSKASYSKLIKAAAKKHGVPASIAHAVVQVESNFNPRARGRAGEVGLMQIKPATARGMGYRGSVKGLYDPQTNLEWGMKYLAGAHERASGDVCGTILRYNAGHYAKRMNPISRRYCQKVKRILASS
ncbi:lytic transglycosylase domain-containing protein [Roseibium sp.]|uniref:lytic transglycosylase domain-containing protein n=1 Tax=Roseibium sp. TaxID=1936156 RepID=UPI003A986E2A